MTKKAICLIASVLMLVGCGANKRQLMYSVDEDDTDILYCYSYTNDKLKRIKSVTTTDYYYFNNDMQAMYRNEAKLGWQMQDKGVKYKVEVGNEKVTETTIIDATKADLCALNDKEYFSYFDNKKRTIPIAGLKKYCEEKGYDYEIKDTGQSISLINSNNVERGVKYEK